MIKNRAREVMERNWIIIQTGEEKCLCWWLKITQKECYLLGFCVLSLVLCRPGTKTFLCVFEVLFLAQNDSRAKDVCFL